MIYIVTNKLKQIKLLSQFLVSLNYLKVKVNLKFIIKEIKIKKHLIKIKNHLHKVNDLNQDYAF